MTITDMQAGIGIICEECGFEGDENYPVKVIEYRGQGIPVCGDCRINLKRPGINVGDTLTTEEWECDGCALVGHPEGPLKVYEVDGEKQIACEECAETYFPRTFEVEVILVLEDFVGTEDGAYNAAADFIARAHDLQAARRQGGASDPLIHHVFLDYAVRVVEPEGKD